jgi:hypothetical protein
MRIAVLPMEVRGYGHVKARAMSACRAALAGAVRDYSNPVMAAESIARAVGQ